MGTVATRLAALAARAEARALIPADDFGAALLVWCEQTALPPERELALAILDLEESTLCTCPQALDAELLAAIDLVRSTWTAYAATPNATTERALDEARKALRHIARDLGRSRLRQARLAVPGRTGPV